MIDLRFDGLYISCNKCGRRIRFAEIFSNSVVKKYNLKKSYCGRCIQARLHRNDPDWNFDEEFAYDPPVYSKETKALLDLLSRCIL